VIEAKAATEADGGDSGGNGSGNSSGDGTATRGDGLPIELRLGLQTGVERKRVESAQRLVFLRIPKNASTSIIKMLERAHAKQAQGGGNEARSEESQDGIEGGGAENQRQTHQAVQSAGGGGEQPAPLPPPPASTTSTSASTSMQRQVVVSGHNEVFALCKGDQRRLERIAKLCRAPAGGGVDGGGGGASSASSGDAHARATREQNEPNEPNGTGPVDIDSSYLESIAAATRIALADATAPVHDDSTFTFAVVRNPYDRVVSSWMYTASWWCSFPEFVELLASRGLRSTEWTWHQRVHICEQAAHLLDGEGRVGVDYIARVEHLEEDMAELCTLLGLPRCEIPRENGQERGDYRGYYTSERLKSLVREVYTTDFQLTGVEF